MTIKKIATPVILEEDWHDYFNKKSAMTGISKARLYRNAFEVCYGEDKKRLEGQLAYQQALEKSRENKS